LIVSAFVISIAVFILFFAYRMQRYFHTRATTSSWMMKRKEKSSTTLLLPRDDLEFDDNEIMGTSDKSDIQETTILLISQRQTSEESQEIEN